MSIDYLKRCDQHYYNTGDVLVSDKEYDILKRAMREQYPDDAYFQTIGAVPAGTSVSLPYILGSLVKTKADGTLLKWCFDKDIKQLCISDKLDGVSIFAQYRYGKLVRATTRGNGYEGKDITEKVRLVRPTVDCKGDVDVRGEAVMTADNCEYLGYSLPRSAVAGILNGDDQEHFDKMKLVDILWYNVLGKALDIYPDHYRILGDCGLDFPYFTMVEVSDNLENELVDYFAERKENSLYDIDGIVLANHFDPSVGDDYYPSNMVAFKVNEDAVEVEVTSVDWNVKRSGKLAPVVNFTPVRISGSQVAKATGFNMKFIIDNNIGKGSRIGIVKSGDIIPYITECYTRADRSNFYELPSVCPSCGERLNITTTLVDLMCNNPECADKIIYKIEHFLLAHEVEEVTATTIRKLNITSIEELYTLTDFDISTIEGMGMKRAQVILSELKKTLKTTPEKLLKSFGIVGIGNTVSNLIMNKFGDFDSLFNKDVSDFMALDGIGSVLANNLVNGLTQNIPLYNFLKKQGLTFEEKAGVSLQGKIITLTGKSDINRNDLTRMIVSHGGMVKGISKNVDLLVTNDTNSQSSKAKKARSYGISIITYDDLLNIIR